METTSLCNESTRILVVDDDEGIRRLILAILDKDGYHAEAAEDALVAQKKLELNEYDVVISDIVMPKLSGIELLKILNKNNPDVPVILITGQPNLESAAEAIRTASAMDYLTKPFSTQDILLTVERAAQIKHFRDENRRLTAENNAYQFHLEEMVKEKSAELTRAYGEIRNSYDFTLEALIAMLDARENATGKHSVRVRELSLLMAHKLKLSPTDLDTIARGTLLHDIGKISIPDAILLKPGKLSKEEWIVMKTHVQTGYDIVKSSEYLAPAAEIIYSHHEKYDGSGYPRGLKGHEICLGARIFALVDAYDAMRSIRVYKGSVSEKEALAEIIRCSGAHFDPEMVDLFLTCQPEVERIAQWDKIVNK